MQINVDLAENVVARMDGLRGSVPRTRWLAAALEGYAASIETLREELDELERRTKESVTSSYVQALRRELASSPDRAQDIAAELVSLREST